jgi:hypothetical protein
MRWFALSPSVLTVIMWSASTCGCTLIPIALSVEPQLDPMAQQEQPRNNDTHLLLLPLLRLVPL